jgi:ABC transporter substrate binding protein
MASYIGRRKFLATLGGAAGWPLAARAQQAGKIPKVGFLFSGTDAVAPARIAALIEGLQAAGYRVPDQVELITRVTGADPSRVAPMAADLVERNVNVLVAGGPAAVHAVRSLTSTIPIVAIDLETDPLGSGMVKGLARPGGNITGLFLDFPDFSKKWLELMKEALPQLAKIGVLWDPATGLPAAQGDRGSCRIDEPQTGDHRGAGALRARCGHGCSEPKQPRRAGHAVHADHRWKLPTDSTCSRPGTAKRRWRRQHPSGRI